MKKYLKCVIICLCLLCCSMFLTACNNDTIWITPTFDLENEGYTIEFVSNEEADVVFPIDGIKLDHSKFTQESCLEYRWVIKKNGSNEILGWIDTGSGYDVNLKKGTKKYGYSPSYENGTFTFGRPLVRIFLKSTDMSVFDNMKFEVNVGSLEIPEYEESSGNASQIYKEYNSETDTWNISQGSQNFVYVTYVLNIFDIEPKTIKSIDFTLNFPNFNA